MVLKTGRLTLRPFAADDLHTTFAYAGDVENTRFMLFLPHDTQEDTARFLREAAAEWEKARPAYYEFAVERGGAHIGAVSLYLSDDRATGELGWILHSAYWGGGYTAEAAAALVEFAAGIPGLTRLIAHCDSRNRGSVRVMEKLGMTPVPHDGVRYDKMTRQPVRELAYELVLDKTAGMPKQRGGEGS